MSKTYKSIGLRKSFIYILIRISMNLLLTSQGLTSKKIINSVKKILHKPLSIYKVVMLSSGPRNEKVLGYINKFKEPLIRIGLKENNIKIIFLNEENKINLSNFDIIFVCGGNTYAYLYYIKKLGLDKFIKQFIKSNKLYIGVSAGSMLVGPTIDYDDSEDKFGIKDSYGLNLIDIVIFPHYSKDKEKKFKKLKNQFKKVIPLKDNQAVLVTDKTIEII